MEHDHGYVAMWDAKCSGWFDGETGELFKGLRVTADDIVLDVGCGDGGISHFCGLQGAAMILADSDPEKVAAAERAFRGTPARSVRTIVSDSNPLPLPAETASVVIATEVLEHVDDPDAFLTEIVRVGRRGAAYLLTVPDPVAENLQKTLAPPGYFEKPNHIRIIGRDEFARMVEKAGLVIERRGSYGFYWAMWWLMFWACNVDLSDPRHPILENWARTWGALLDTSQGAQIKGVLDTFMPKSQLIIARKP